MMLMEVTTTAGQKVGALIDLASDKNYITHEAADSLKLRGEKMTIVVHRVGKMAIRVSTKRYLLRIRVKTPKGTEKAHQFICYGLEEIAMVHRSMVTLLDIVKTVRDLIKDLDLGVLTAVTHRANTRAAGPVCQPIRRTPLGFQEEEERHLNAILEAGVVTSSASEWSPPVVLVRKMDGGVRSCVDYRHLNSVTAKDAYPLPKIEECLDVLRGACVFSTLDLQSGYWQIAVDEMDRAKTAFITRYGLYEYTRMPFGLCNAPSTF
ncbi:Retrovirus-related Pol poly from transposon [Labeo rohita]|uniref:ribonuclease H n=1 Tax=Labeo rohita TaxID=84645 RepID=A0A498N6W2_LABRO|nr:Retrovirus-related Pol poly from transposon [Labeo rohita]